MSSIKPGLRSWVAARSAITSAGATVHITVVAQGSSLPYVRVLRQDQNRNGTLSDNDDSLVFEQMQLDCVASTADVAETLAAALVDDSAGLPALEGQLLNGRRVVAVNDLISEDSYFEAEDGSGAHGHVVSVRCQIQHTT